MKDLEGWAADDAEERVKRALRREAEAGGSMPPPGSWDEVVATARHRRQARSSKATLVASRHSPRARARRSAAGWRRARTGLALAAVVAAVAGAIYLRGSTGRGGETDVAPSAAAEDGDGRGASAPLSFPACDPSGQPPAPDALPDDEVSDLQLTPTWLPGDEEVEDSHGERIHRCPGLDDVEPVLVIRAMSGDDTIDAVVRVRGPFSSHGSRPADEELSGGSSYTEVRGTRAHVKVVGANQRLTWTEPDDLTWVLSGAGVDTPTLREVAEGLELDGTPASGGSFASLPAEDVPSGFEPVWQASASQRPEEPSSTVRAWVVDGDACQVRFEERPGNATYAAIGGRPGDRLVSGEEGAAGWLTAPGTLRWDAGNQVLGVASCESSPGLGDPSAAAQLVASTTPVADPVDTGPP
jgi:hypothetical protein